MDELCISLKKVMMTSRQIVLVTALCANSRDQAVVIGQRVDLSGSFPGCLINCFVVLELFNKVLVRMGQ